MEPDQPKLSKRCYVHAVKIDKLWGYRDVAITFRPDVNILIGPNGSGKTTVLNMIADILLLDFDALAKISFDAIALDFIDPETKKTPRIVVNRRKSGALQIDEGFEIEAFESNKAKSSVASQRIAYQYRASQ